MLVFVVFTALGISIASLFYTFFDRRESRAFNRLQQRYIRRLEYTILQLRNSYEKSDGR